MSGRSSGLALSFVALGLISGVLCFVLLLGGTAPAAAGQCAPGGPAVVVDQSSLPIGRIAGYDAEQLRNAASIMNPAAALDLGIRAQTIAVMTAMGESSLRVLDRGDRVGPDSRGLFQQRATGWGSYADRMDPAISATNFYKGLLSIEDWDTLAPTIAAHRVQNNADPYYYEPFWDAAVEVVHALADTAVTGVAPGTGGLSCTAESPGSVPAHGWTTPALGPVTSGYGYRVHPITGDIKLHEGTDIGAPCVAPIYAAAAGVVIRAGPARGFGRLILIDHGRAVVTGYGHMPNNGLLVDVGDTVKAGQEIARVGANGLADGCHLHFEVRLKGATVDPVPYLRGRGVTLG